MLAEDIAIGVEHRFEGGGRLALVPAKLFGDKIRAFREADVSQSSRSCQCAELFDRQAVARLGDQWTASCPCVQPPDHSDGVHVSSGNGNHRGEPVHHETGIRSGHDDGDASSRWQPMT